jgi:hypothetical protein
VRCAAAILLASFALVWGDAAAAAAASAGGKVLAAIAHAVEGAESSWGSDPRMWRPDPAAAQGPMQITAAAAQDVGGGNRFDPRENLTIGRAYLAHMYRRFGSWPDAVAAYNWGPGHMESWIRSGRSTQKMPLQVMRYRARVLVAAAMPVPPEAAFSELLSRAPRIRRLGIVHPQPHRSARPNANDPVNQLFAEVMAASTAH